MKAFPPPSSGEVAASYADGGCHAHMPPRLMTPSVADYRATSPEDGGGKGEAMSAPGYAATFSRSARVFISGWMR